MRETTQVLFRPGHLLEARALEELRAELEAFDALPHAPLDRQVTYRLAFEQRSFVIEVDAVDHLHSKRQVADVVRPVAGPTVPVALQLLQVDPMLRLLGEGTQLPRHMPQLDGARRQIHDLLTNVAGRSWVDDDPMTGSGLTPVERKRQCYNSLGPRGPTKRVADLSDIPKISTPGTMGNRLHSHYEPLSIAVSGIRVDRRRT